MKLTPAQVKLNNAFPQLEKAWDDEVIPQLQEYIKIPNKSPMFDPDWEKNGYMQQATELIKNWCEKQPIANRHIEIIQTAGRTPLLFIDIAATDSNKNSSDSILLYGHLDKQPEMRGWREGLGPWQPVIEDGKLYGRGGADDGYSAFAAITAISMLEHNQIPHQRCVILIEASEESGSIDLPFYLEKLYSRIGEPNLIICLDSGCGNYEQLWGTTSLRGLVGGTLSIEILKYGIHSGMGGGVVPTPFSILRLLLDRIEDAASGKILLSALNTPILEEHQKYITSAAKVLEKNIMNDYPFQKDVAPLSNNIETLLQNRTWHPALAITGVEGFPSIENAGNVLLPNLKAKLSIRIPPNCEPSTANTMLKEILEKEPPHQARIQYIPEKSSAGWLAPKLADWLAAATDTASQLFFNKSAAYMGEGGSIPFMKMLGDHYPKAQFLITGVLGPNSNAHGPNEFLHIDMVKKITGCIAAIIAAHYQL